MSPSSSLIAVLCCLSLPIGAQDDPGAGRTRQFAATAIREWVEDYEQDRLNPRGELQREAGLQPRYAATAREAGLLSANDPGNLTHLDALQKVLSFAEYRPDEAIGDSLLGLAAAGLDKSLIDRDAMVLRDLGHWSLMRIDHQGVWFLIMRAAAGERLPLFAAERADAPVDPARRVAALKLLGMKALPVFRSSIEAALADVDPRVRLAAVEALDFQRRPESLPTLTRVLGSERHPIVSQAVVRAVVVTMKAAGDRLEPEQQRRAVGTALRRLGQCGWRTDMDLIDLAAAYPHKSSIPELIGVLERAALPPDALLELINKHASPLLRERAYQCLRGLTGAILPADQPRRWRDFWLTEQDRIEVPKVLPSERGVGSTRSTFYGIPVLGREIAFVIDTSGSMEEAVDGTVTRSGRPGPRQPTRLSTAKEQLLMCVQAMEPESRYHLITFSSEAHTWSRKAVPPTAQATRSLTELLSRLQPQGGTNIYHGLVQALQLDQLRYGEENGLQIDELFLLSDGEPTEGAVKDSEEILRLFREANRYQRVRINTVFAGDGKGADFLRRLAQENDGVFVQRK